MNYKEVCDHNWPHSSSVKPKLSVILGGEAKPRHSVASFLMLKTDLISLTTEYKHSMLTVSSE